MTTRIYKERHLYFFECDGCGNKRQSFKRSRAKAKMCRKCRRVEIPENQLPLL